jgi:hypothetical protein
MLWITAKNVYCIYSKFVTTYCCRNELSLGQNMLRRLGISLLADDFPFRPKHFASKFITHIFLVVMACGCLFIVYYHYSVTNLQVILQGVFAG